MPASSLTRFLPPIARQLARKRAAREKAAAKIKDRKPTATGKDRRKRDRITIEQLNKLSEKELQELGEKAKEKQDVRPTYVKALDWLDVPRNAVFNVIGSLAGVDKEKVRKGTFMPKVYASDVLEKLGWKGKSTGTRVARGAVGFMADVALDPLTYLSAGATTGTKVLKAAPKILKPGTKAVRAGINAMVRGGKVSKDVVGALGRSQKVLARMGSIMAKKYGAKKAVRMLAKSSGRKGAWAWQKTASALRGASGTKARKAAEKFVTKFGEKGRTLLRVPFMSKGLTLPGTRRKLWQAFKEGATGLGEAGAASKGVGAAASAVRRGVATIETAKQTLAQRRAAAKAVRAGATAKKAAKQEKLFAGMAKAKLAPQTATGAPAAKAVAKTAPTATSGPVIAATRRTINVRQALADAQNKLASADSLEKHFLRKEIGLFKDALAKGKTSFQDIAKPPPGFHLTTIGDEALYVSTKLGVKASEKAIAAFRAGTQVSAGAAAKTVQAAAKAPKTPVALTKQTPIAQAIQSALTRTQPAFAKKAAQEAFRGQAAKGIAQHFKSGTKSAKQAVQAGKQALEAAQGAEGVARAKYTGLLSAKDAPQPVQELARTQFGTAAKGGLRRWLREKFGQPDSPLQQQLQAKKMQASMGSAAAGGHGGLQIREALTPVVETLAAKTGMASDDVAKHLVDALELTGKKGAGQFDVGLQRFLASPIGQSDEAKAFVETYRQAQGGPWDKLTAAHARLGLPAPKEAALGHVAGVLDKGAQKAIKAQQVATQKTPFDPARMKVRQMTRQQSMQPLQSQVVKQGGSTEQQLVQQGYQKGRTGFPTSAQRDAMTQQGNLGGLVGDAYRGSLYGRDIPLSAAKGIAETSKRTAMLEGVEQIMPYSMPITPQEVGGLQARGLGMVDQTLFAKHPLNGTGIEKLLAGKAFPQPVKELFDDFLRSTANPKEVGKVLKASDWMFGKWKSFALFHPAYTLRNMFQNLFGATMAGANPFKVAKRSISSDVNKIFKAIESGADVGDDVFRFAGGSRPMREVMLALKGTNMANAGLTADIMYDSLTGSQRVGKMMGGPTGAWFRMNNRVETQMRIGLWANFVDDGYSYGEAAQRVLKGMPDLSDLTVWERNVGKRLFPWYSWMRKNGALQASYLMNQPGWMAGSEKARHAMEEAFVGADKVDEQLRPKWMQEQQAFQVAGDSKEGHMWLLASWLPFQDLVKIASGTMSLQEGARAGLEQMRPEIKFVAEQATGHDIFRRQELADQSTPQALKNVFPALLGRSGTPLDNLLAIRPIKEYGKRVFEMPTAGAGIARAVLGGAIQPANRQRGLQTENIKIREQMMKVRGQINRAREAGDQAALKNLMRLWIQLNARASRLGLPSVAKRTQQTLSQFGLPQGEPAFAQ